MKKFPKIKYPSHRETDGLLDGEVVVLEKLDGANFRFTWDDDGDLKIGTRNVVYDDPWDENRPHAFEHSVEYIEDVVDHVADVDLVFFGESMHLHSLDYEGIDWENPHKGAPHVPLDSDTPNVVLFDVWDNEGEEWLDWDEVEEWSFVLGIPHAPVVERGEPEDLALEVPEESEFGGPPEGIVVRRTDGLVRAKKVTEDFKEQNAISFNDPSKASGDAVEFVAAYITEPRIEKTAHKLVDEGEYDSLQMPMMEDLPRRVIEDAFTEIGWDELICGPFEAEWDDEFKSEVRSKTSKKCARTLRQMVQQI